jgi:23S rRNA pseudouridine1911/1915/1917 synthase
VNGEQVSQYNYMLNAGDIVSINKPKLGAASKRLRSMSIIYEDKDVIVVDKDAGLLSVSTEKAQLKDTAYNIVNEYLRSKKDKKKPYVLFRLDREVSGIMIFAKNEETQEDLQSDWALHPPLRTYTAIVEGKPSPVKGTITSWLTENKNFVMFASETDNGGLKAVTHYETIGSIGKYSLLKITPETARKNQIRVQLQSIGHPVVGDKKYGSRVNPIRRIALHASGLKFIHPVKKEWMDLVAPLPRPMQAIATTILKEEHPDL